MLGAHLSMLCATFKEKSRLLLQPKKELIVSRGPGVPREVRAQWLAEGDVQAALFLPLGEVSASLQPQTAETRQPPAAQGLCPNPLLCRECYCTMGA